MGEGAAGARLLLAIGERQRWILRLYGGTVAPSPDEHPVVAGARARLKESLIGALLLIASYGGKRHRPEAWELLAIVRGWK
jgi:hypothetical protein